MIFPVFATGVIGVLSWVLYSWFCLLRNYSIARKTGLPLRIIPISHENRFWMVIDSYFIPIFAKLPFGNGNFTRFNWRGWEFKDKYRAHEEIGDIFMLVTPGRNWIYLCNPEALLEVLKNNQRFPRPLELFEMVNVFGDNLSNTEGKQWQKHRKITATAFNEQNNLLVWSESLHQARDMVEYWGKQDRVLTTADDTRTLSLHVLSGAGFGKTHPFQGHDQKGAKSVSADYKESLQTVLDNAILLFLLGTKFISKPWLPSKCRDLNQAVIKFKKYMTEEYEAGKAGVAGGAAANTNLMTQLVRASLEQDGLSETEIYGNLFVFNFAGHDTTAHTFTFAITLLATSPETQQWLAEELDHVFGHRPMKEWDYSEDYPRLKRTLAILYETIRLYSPVPIAKSTGRTDQYLVVEGESYFLPRNSLLIPNHVALHTHPKFWGQDSLCWKPQRWIEQPSPTDLDEERFTAIRRGSFIPWSEGIRICPGKKFSQVEFTAAIAAIFKNWRVEPQVFPGETLEGACARVSKLVEEDTAQVLLLQMLHPERAPLVWKRRETVR